MHTVAGEITDILVTEKISEREAIICINSGMILYREIEIPKPKSGNETFVIETIIQNEMSLGDDYNITYSISEEIATDEGPKLKVIAAACPQKIIDIYLELARQVGLRTKLVVVSNNNITRLVRRSSVYKAFSPLLLMQIDRNFININLYNKGAVAFSRYTKIDASDYENSPDYVNLAIFDNLFRTMHLLEQSGYADRIKEIQYFGEIKDTKALHATIGQLNLQGREFEYPTDLVRSKRNFDFIEYANVIGSLIKVDEKTENINLLNTKEKRIKSKNVKFSLIALLAGVICAVVVLSLFGVFKVIESGRQNTLRGIQDELRMLNAEAITARIEEKKIILQAIKNYADSVDMSKILFDFQPKMTRDIPERLVKLMEPYDGMYISGGFDVNGYTAIISFTCLDDKHPALFVDDLVADNYFENIIFYGYSRERLEEQDIGEDYEFIMFQVGMRIKGGNIFEP
jgi:type IV pilus assembly protein PilM